MTSFLKGLEKKSSFSIRSNSNNNNTQIEISQEILQLPKEKILEIAGKMAHGGIDVKDRKYRFQTYEKTWRADEFCTGVLTFFPEHIKSRMESIMFGQHLMDLGYCVHPAGKHTFEDGEYFYRFTEKLLSDPASFPKETLSGSSSSGISNPQNKSALGGLYNSLTGKVASKDPTLLPYVVVKQGWLSKKNQDRFFVLEKTTNRLYWFKKEPDPNLDWSKTCQSFLEVIGLKITQSPSTSFEIQDPANRVYLLNAASLIEMKNWVDAIKKLVVDSAKTSASRIQGTTINQSQAVRLEKSGWLVKKGQKRFFTLKESIIAWYLTEKLDTVKGHLDLTNCTVEFSQNIKSFTIYNPGGETYILTAKDQQECSEWVAILKLASSGKGTSASATLESTKEERVGWMTKKNKKRWFILQDETLRWYKTQGVTKEQNCLPLSDCTVNNIDHFTFLISTPDDSWYNLKAATEHEAKNWVGWIREAIANEQRLIDAGLQKRGWLEKKLKKRWYALRNGVLMWFSQRQTFENIVTANANSWIRCEEYDVRLNENKISFTIEHKIDKQDKTRHWNIKASSPSEAEAWVQAILSASNPAKEKKLGKVFGVPLEKQEFNSDKIPVSVDHIASFIIKCGLDIQGIFRLSGATSRVSELKNSYDVGNLPPLNPKNDDDVHAVAGLLKAWLRELPEPLLTFDLYIPLLKAGDDLSQIGELLCGLPEANYECLRYLFNFMAVVNQHSDKNQMIASNLAIVFGPNLLRSRAPSAAELTHTPHIIQLITVMINNCENLFGKLNPASWKM